MLASHKTAPGRHSGLPRIKDFQLLRKLGEGSMARVYLAVHAVIGKKVAIKILRHRMRNQPVIVQRFYDEVRAVSQLDHVGIVSVHDMGETDDGNLFYVMEYVDGQTLDAYIAERGPRSVMETIRFGIQIASALAMAHEKELVHRDLKPGNILVAPDPEADGLQRTKIFDFGIAKLPQPSESIAPASTQAGALLGTTQYMAPEQWFNASAVDDRADVYALGLILFELLTGQPPYSGSDRQLLRMHQSQALPLASCGRTLPTAMSHLLLRMTEKAPRERLNMRQVIARLRALEATLLENRQGAARLPAGQELGSPPVALRSLSGLAAEHSGVPSALMSEPGTPMLRLPGPQPPGNPESTVICLDAEPESEAERQTERERQVGVGPAPAAGSPALGLAVSEKLELPVSEPMALISSGPTAVAARRPQARPRRLRPIVFFCSLTLGELLLAGYVATRWLGRPQGAFWPGRGRPAAQRASALPESASLAPWRLPLLPYSIPVAMPALPAEIAAPPEKLGIPRGRTPGSVTSRPAGRKRVPSLRSVMDERASAGAGQSAQPSEAMPLPSMEDEQ